MTSGRNYWQDLLAARMSRRRALAATGTAAIAVAGAAAIGCSGGSSSGGSPSDTSGLLSYAQDTSKQARKGGTFKHFYASDISNLDPIPLAVSGALRNRIYQKLLMPRPGYLERARLGEVVPDAAESWEISPDKLQITLKLRPNNHYDPRPPTNGRVLTAEDVVYNFQRTEKQSSRRTDLFKSQNADAPILSYQALDPRTFVIKLTYPDAGLIANLATQNSGYFGGLLPANAEESGINIRTDPRGSGPWYLSRYTPSVTLEFLPNPGYFDRERPYIEKIESPIVPEYATRLAQFRAGAIHTMPVNASDVLQVKRDVPELRLLEADSVNTPTMRTMWGWRDSAKAPFRDERVRQAFALSLDRDLYIDAIYSVSDFTKVGLPVETRWNGAALRGTYSGWWLDPQDQSYGTNRKLLNYDIVEAKRLLAAAGYKDGVDSDVAYVTTGPNAAGDQRSNEIVIGMVQDAGIRLKTIAADLLTDWTAVYYLGKGNFDGLAFSAPTGGADPGNELYTYYNTRGGLFTGFDANGRSSFAGDPQVDQLTTRIRQEFDPAKRWALAQELERHEAKKQYFPLFPGGAGGFQLAWPVLGNFGVYRMGQSDAVEPTWWIDDSQVKRG